MPSINLLTIRSWWDFHNAWLGVVLSFGLTGTITNIVKITAGRPRPDLISRCMPRPGSENERVFGLTESKICTQTNGKIMMDGFRSFFSGHSSLSFAGLGFLFFYVSGKMHLFDKRGHAGKAWIAFVPLVGATLIAITRTMDYRHHWQDVLVGGIVGLTISHFSYRQYYPPLNHPYSHRPYSPRVARAPTDRHEEQPSQMIDQAPTASNTNPVMASSVAPPKSLVQRSLSDDGTIERQNPDLSEMWMDGGSKVQSRPNV
ncbi:hypothetical protein FRC03_006588 [Tulasnella sp. 419]|nr:hypothetical protein FRC03_006588 [Tulasnella sp. 419]